LRKGSAYRPVLLGFVVFAIAHPVVYVYKLGHFARDKYIDWYFVPQVFLGAVAFAVGVACAARVAKLSFRLPAIFLGCSAVAGVFVTGHAQAKIKSSYSHVSPFVKLGRELNLVTPAGARIASFSSGTQAFLLTDGRSMTNIDGLINSVDFIRRYLVGGDIERYLCENGIEYFSDYAGDLQFAPVYWHSGAGFSSIFRTSALELIAQGPGWGNGYLNISKIHCGGGWDRSTRELVKRDGAAIGRLFVTSHGRQVEVPIQRFQVGRGLVLASTSGSETSNAFNFVPVEAGTYKVTVELERVGDASSRLDAPVARVSFASWADGVTFGETVFQMSDIADRGKSFRLVIYGSTGRPYPSAEVRIANLGAGIDILVKEVTVYKLDGLLVDFRGG
jgi:hypothetical protein